MSSLLAPRNCEVHEAFDQTRWHTSVSTLSKRPTKHVCPSPRKHGNTSRSVRTRLAQNGRGHHHVTQPYVGYGSTLNVVVSEPEARRSEQHTQGANRRQGTSYVTPNSMSSDSNAHESDAMGSACSQYRCHQLSGGLFFGGACNKLTSSTMRPIER